MNLQMQQRRLMKSMLGVFCTVLLVVGVILPAFANLTGSPFDAGDGNLVLNDETQDWANAPNLKVGLDKPTGSTDDSFGQGTKEDSAVPTVTDGSIPPNKSDLTRFYVANQRVGTKEFLYLAWERVQEPNGTTNMDFEFNQSSALSSNGVTPVRTAGDVLIKYDLAQGGTHPVLGYHLWVTTGSPAAVCEASNSLPCWGKVQSLAGNFEGSINDPTNNPPSGSVIDPIPPLNPRTLSARTFGEGAINLTDSGILPPGSCKSFGAAYLKSRSSDAFTSAVKDFIAPIPVSISNCGQIIIRKVTSPSPDPTDTSFGYTTTGGLTPASFSLKNGGVRDYGDQVQAGSYSVTESDPGPNFVLSGLDCSASDTSHGSTVGTDTTTRTATIVLKAEDTIDCTYTNTLQRGAIKITKTSTKGNAPLAGAEFEIRKKSDGSLVATVTTGDDGVACKDQLLFDTYTVQETKAPTGYKINDAAKHDVIVDQVGTCGSGTEEDGGSFTDTPLSEIQVKFKSLAGAGVTSASIVCENAGTTVDAVSENGADDPAFDDTDETFTNLDPGTYDCQVVVDP